MSEFEDKSQSFSDLVKKVIEEQTEKPAGEAEKKSAQVPAKPAKKETVIVEKVGELEFEEPTEPIKPLKQDTVTDETVRKVVFRELQETVKQVEPEPVQNVELREYLEPVKPAEPEKIKLAEPEPAPPAEPEQKIMRESLQPVSEIGVISAATSIVGTVSSKGHMRIEGDIVGNVFVFGDINVTGKVSGDIDVNNIELEGCSIIGDIKARGDITVGRYSKLTGDMNGQLIAIDGTVEGKIEAQKSIHMSGTSAVKGSITATTLSMSAGAELQGSVKVSGDDDL